MLSVKGDGRWEGGFKHAAGRRMMLQLDYVRSCKRSSNAVQTRAWQSWLTKWRGPLFHSPRWLNRKNWQCAVQKFTSTSFIQGQIPLLAVAVWHSTIEHTIFTLCIRPRALSVASEFRDQQLPKPNFLASYGKPTTSDSYEIPTFAVRLSTTLMSVIIKRATDTWRDGRQQTETLLFDSGSKAAQQRVVGKRRDTVAAFDLMCRVSRALGATTCQ